MRPVKQILQIRGQNLTAQGDIHPTFQLEHLGTWDQFYVCLYGTHQSPNVVKQRMSIGWRDPNHDQII